MKVPNIVIDKLEQIQKNILLHNRNIKIKQK